MGKKLLVVFVLVVIIIGIVLCVVYKDDIKNAFHKESIEDKMMVKLQEEGFFQNLDDGKKQEIEEKFDDIVKSDEYQELDKNEQEELLDKFISSERLKDELEKEKATQKKSEDIVIPEDATEEEKSALEQEKDSLLLQETIKDVVSSDDLSISYQNSYIRKINSIYIKGTNLFINADIVQEEAIVGVAIVSQYNNFVTLSSSEGNITSEMSLEEILTMLRGDLAIILDKGNNNLNKQSQIDFFNNNQNNLGGAYSYFSTQGYEFKILESWDNKNGNPEFILEASKGKKTQLFHLFEGFSGYAMTGVEKACPEFWAQLEIEQGKQQ